MNIYPQQWKVIVLPEQNSIVHPLQDPIKIEFSRKMNVSSLNQQNISIIGSKRGKYHFTDVNYDSVSNQASIKTTRSFFALEEITVILTSSIQDSDSNYLPQPYIWSFTTSTPNNVSNFSETRALRFNYGNTPHFAKLVDMDGDNDLDVFFSGGGEIVSWQNDGKGNFSNAKWHTNSGWEIVYFDFADFDSDGDIDIVFENDSIRFLINDGKGVFTEKREAVRTNNFGLRFNPADMNGDGAMDIVVHHAQGFATSVFLNDGKMNFAERQKILHGDYFNDYGCIGDFDNNGTMDVVIILGRGTSLIIAETRVQLYSNDGTGELSLKKEILYSGFSYDITPGDVDMDGDLDLVFANSTYVSDNQLYILQNNGDWNFAQVKKFNRRSATGGPILCADVEGDGDLDFISVDYQFTYGSIALYKNSPEGVFAHSDIWSTGGPNNVDVGDIDNDGDGDIIVCGHQTGAGSYIGIMENVLPTGIHAITSDQLNPTHYELKQNYPNPFNGATVIQYYLPSDSKVNIDIYDVLGRKVTTLLHDDQKQGAYQIKWNPKISSGLYLCQLNAQSIEDRTQRYTSMVKMQYLK